MEEVTAQKIEKKLVWGGSVMPQKLKLKAGSKVLGMVELFEGYEVGENRIVANVSILRYSGAI